jgi:hypothetical protein
VKRALIKDGWTITDEQVTLIYGGRTLFVDMQATRNEDGFVILAEVKELYDVDSEVEAFANAIGKYVLYRTGLMVNKNPTPIYLAVTEKAYLGILSSRIGKTVIEYLKMLIVVVDHENEVIVRWMD